jgi:MFS family permease
VSVPVRSRLPRGVWALGLVSLFMDISSEMIHALLPIYIVSVFGAPVLTVGLIEGVAEATALMTRVFSGVMSDRLGRRKRLAAIGYGLAAFSKPIFPLAPGIGWLVTARFVDRVGKGIRGAPRDAMIADMSPPELRGASFGLRQSLDTVGAFMGPLLAIGLMLVTANSFRTVFWVAVIPAFLSFAIIAFGVHDSPKSSSTHPKTTSSSPHWRELPAEFFGVVAIASVFTLARFSEAFLVLRARDAGLPVALIPGVLVVMNIVYASSSYPIGALSDRIGRHGILYAGIALLIVADLLLALGGTISIVLLGVAVWGLHMGFTQGLLSSLVADTAPEALRGTAFGFLNFSCGVALFIASVLAGGLWDNFGPRASFLVSAGLTALSLCGLLLWNKRSRGTS